jgi:glucokinase
VDVGTAIGLDVGGTKIAAGLVAFPSGRVLARRRAPTEAARGGPAVLATGLELAHQLAAEADGPVRALGLAVCELVDRCGRVTSEQTIAWRGAAIAPAFAGLAPAVVESDVRAAALAEARWGAGRGFDPFAYVTVGSGISSTLVQGGRPFAGARGNALVLASAPLRVVCPACGAPNETVLEEVAAGGGVVARYNARRPGSATRGEEVTAAAAAGDPEALAVLREAGAALGVAVGFLVNVLDPAALVVGGGLGLAGGAYWQSLVASIRAQVWSDDTRALPILPAGLGADAGIVGAAAAAWQRFVEGRRAAARRGSG